MKNIFLFIFILATTLIFADERVLVADTPVKLENFPMSYFVESSEKLSLDAVKKESFIASKNKLALGTKAKATWSKIIISNQSNLDKRLFLHRPYTYHVKAIDFYVTQESKTVKTVWLTLSYGLLANVFEVYGESVFRLHISPLTMPIFLLLFLITVFNTKEDYKTEHKALLFIFIIFNAVAILYYKGFIEFNYVTSHAVGIGIMLEALMLGFILSYRIKLLEEIKITIKRADEALYSAKSNGKNRVCS